MIREVKRKYKIEGTIEEIDFDLKEITVKPTDSDLDYEVLMYDQSIETELESIYDRNEIARFWVKDERVKDKNDYRCVVYKVEHLE